jgi:hypothetical protein
LSADQFAGMKIIETITLRLPSLSLSSYMVSGVRASSAAATPDGLSALDHLAAGEHFEISAAEDGRTPLNTYLFSASSC